ncbi:shootin-1 isoform X2 [Pelobates fuscus]|uniref:shootin-1 isoform X2 n=1 Tax=Pelobates fuscus TaxID=191477 RepID=UPI002FE4BEFE
MKELILQPSAGARTSSVYKTGTEWTLYFVRKGRSAAIEQYEELVTENETTKNQYDQVKKERDDAVKKLEEFNKISHKVIEEVSFIQSNLEIEKTCRESAEALASKLSKENKNLKRISMLCIAKLGPDVITKEISLDEGDSASDDGGTAVCTSLECQQIIKELGERSLAFQQGKQLVESELESLRSKLVDLIEEVNITKKENVMLRKEVSDQRKILQKYNRVSMLAVEEYEELQTNLEMEKDLREKAESLAHEMYIEQNKLKRQSHLLLQSCAPNDQLLKALEENAKLTQALEEDRIQHQRKVKELEEKLEEDKLQKEIESLKKQMDLLEEDRRDLEAKFQSSESTVRDLKHSVEALQKRIQQAENPPPPPPPPPPPLPPPPPSAIQSFISLIRKKPGVSPNASKKESPAPSDSGSKDDIKRQAVEEMMDRIKKGVHLRPVQANRVKPKPVETNPSSSAVQELRGIVNSMNASSGARRVREMGTAATESELETILRRRKVTTDQDMSSRAGALATLESKSMPVLGSATSSALSQKPKEAELKAGCTKSVGKENLLFKENKVDLKAASQSAETLRYTGREMKGNVVEGAIDIALQSSISETGPTLGTDTANKKAKETDSSNC